MTTQSPEPATTAEPLPLVLTDELERPSPERTVTELPPVLELVVPPGRR
ncbi:hypothetical protein [Methylobacterium durans]|nr:hypothetical protein [Methylobacterium durans]